MLNFLRAYAATFLGKNDEKDETGSEAIQFILLAVILGVGLVAVFAFIRNKITAAGTRVGTCIENGSTGEVC